MRVDITTADLKRLLEVEISLGLQHELAQYVQFEISIATQRASRTICYVNVRKKDYEVFRSDKEIYQALNSLKFDWIGISLANNNKLTFVFGQTQSAIYFETEAALDMFLIKVGDAVEVSGDHRRLK